MQQQLSQSGGFNLREGEASAGTEAANANVRFRVKAGGVGGW